MPVLGVLVLIVTWAFLVAWVGRTAVARGRLPLVWALVGGLSGIAGFALGFLIVRRSIDLDASLAVLILTMLAPYALMILGVAAVNLILVRSAIPTVRTNTWAVHLVGRGDATLHIEGGNLDLAWSDGNRQAPLRDVRAVADGESVRLTIADDELSLMPLGKPDTVEGRRHQSRQLARIIGG